MIERVIEAPGARPGTPYGGVVVGVAESGAGVERAVWEAALWAARRQLDVTLLAATAEPDGTCEPDRTRTEHRRRARRLIDDAARQLTRCAGQKQRIRTAVVTGSAAAVLVAASATADLVVLQRGERHAPGSRIPGAAASAGGSTTASVTSRAACPVLVVHDDDQTAVRRGLLVLLDCGSAVGPGLGQALGEAQRRGAPLTVVLVDPGSDPGTSGAPARATAVADHDPLPVWRRRFPRVPVTEVVVNRFEVGVVLRLAQVCELLVVTRRATVGADRTALGAIARRLVEQARCPVLVVPPDRLPLGHRPTDDPAGAPTPSAGPSAATPIERDAYGCRRVGLAPVAPAPAPAQAVAGAGS